MSLAVDCEGRSENELLLKRREFLIQSAAAAAAPAIAHALPLTVPAGLPEHADPLASAQLIWSAATAPVPIQGEPTSPTPDLHAVFAKEINISIAPSSAVLHLFAFTRYRLYVNGTYIGRGPCRYQNQRPEYDTRDIAAALRPGKNVLAVLVHRDVPTGRIMRHDPGFIATLNIVSGGQRKVIVTDSSWLSIPELSFGPRPGAWASIEEHIDARKTFDWTLPDLSLSNWQPSTPIPHTQDLRFFPRTSPLQLEVERPWSPGGPALPMELSAGSEALFTLPEIAQAFHLLTMDAAEGSSLQVTYELPEGQSSGTSVYINRAGAQRWIGGDTFAFIRLRLRVTEGHIRLTQAAAHEVRYPFERVAAFASSDPFLNRLWSICARSLEVLSEDSYVDCAERERVEWTDDSPPAFDCTRVMMRGPDGGNKQHWGDSRLLAGLLRRIALTERPDGQLKAHSCSERFDIHAIMEDRSCDWVVLLREYQESSGDINLVRELWPTLNRLLGWYRNHRTPRGLVLAREWGVWDNPLRYQVCEGAALNAMLYRALVDASVLAARMGKQKEEQALAQEAQQLQSDYNRLLWNDREGSYDGGLFGPGSELRPQMDQPFTGKIVDGRFGPSAQANLFALYAGIVPPERIASVRKSVLDHLDEVVSPMSFYYLFQMIYAMEGSQQDQLVLQRMRTGWKEQVDSPWQLSWETLEKGGASRAHVYGMHPGYFLTAFVLGARRQGPADQRTILIEPRFSALDWAKGVCITEFGPVEMEWTMKQPTMPEITCTIPRNVHAILRLPAPESAAALEIDGRTVPHRPSNGRLEAPLSPGAHIIRFRS